MIDISVIIVNYRGWTHLERCLNAFESFTTETFSFEVIVVDNCSDDGRFEEFQNRFSRFLFYENNGNNGFSNGCNFGATKALGEYLLFLNSDIITSESAVRALLTASRLNPEIFVLSCKQINNSGKEEQVNRLFPDFFTLFGLTRFLFRKLLQEQLTVKNGIVFTDWVSGSVILISKANFDRIGGWDDRFWLYYEDVDFCKRVTDLGGKVGVDTNVSMIHNHGGSTRINLETASLTKTEVVISLHVYVSIHFAALSAFFLHSLLIFGFLVSKTIPAFLGVPLFFVKRLSLYRKIYFKVIYYYLNTFKNNSWISPRSVKFEQKW